MLGALAVRTVHTSIVGAGGPFLKAAADRKVLLVRLVRLDPDTMRRLKHLAVDRDSTLQALAAEAIGLLFERYEG